MSHREWITRDVGTFPDDNYAFVVRVEREAHMGRWEIFRVIAESDTVHGTGTEADAIATGTIKWDGCLELDGQPHLCGQDMGKAFCQALLVVWEVAAEALSAFDRDCAGLEEP